MNCVWIVRADVIASMLHLIGGDFQEARFPFTVLRRHQVELELREASLKDSGLLLQLGLNFTNAFMLTIMVAVVLITT